MARLYRKLAHCWCCGEQKVTLTVRASTASTLSRKFQIELNGTDGYLPSSSVKTTSSAVSGLPSAQVMPSRSVMVYSVSEVHSPFSASQGMYSLVRGS